MPRFFHRQKSSTILLTKKETQILEMLYNKKGEIVKRDEILKKIWYIKEEKDFYASRSLDVVLTRLRKKIIQEANAEIKTVRGVGISLIP